MPSSQRCATDQPNSVAFLQFRAESSANAIDQHVFDLRYGVSLTDEVAILDFFDARLLHAFLEHVEVRLADQWLLGVVAVG